MSSEGRGEGSEVERGAQPFLYASADGTLSAGTGDIFPFSSGGSAARDEQGEAQAFEKGVRQGEALAREEYEQRLAQIRISVSGAVERFAEERNRYFERVETEVVQLALAVARKILHREAQMDPLLLTGIVHVALQELDSSARVRLRAHPSEAGFWQQYFAQQTESGAVPEVIGDAALPVGECALETEMGTTQISLDTQLKEIEQGFFDLLEQRPRAR